jgi:hypothetical protein
MTMKQMTEAERAEKITAELKVAAQKARLIDLDALALADLTKVKLEPNGEVTGADAAIAALKERWPDLFPQKHMRDMSEAERTEWWREHAKKFPNGAPRPGPMPTDRKAKDMSKAEQEAFLKECARRE